MPHDVNLVADREPPEILDERLRRRPRDRRSIDRYVGRSRVRRDAAVVAQLTSILAARGDDGDHGDAQELVPHDITSQWGELHS